MIRAMAWMGSDWLRRLAPAPTLPANATVKRSKALATRRVQREQEGASGSSSLDGACDMVVDANAA